MIFFLGTLSIIQIFLLPGLLFNKIYKINGSLYFKTISIILISILLNYLIISLLLFFNIYKLEFVYLIFIINLLLFIWRIDLSNKKINFEISLKFITLLFVLILIFLALYKNTGNVFYSWDAVVSYNEWAKHFFQGDYPGGMVRPYLIPKLWSLTYIFINNSEIDFFAKFTTVFFPIIILITCLDDIYEYQKLRDYLKFAFFCLFFYFQRNFILTGYVDIPLVSLITCFFYYLRRNDKFSSLNFSIVSIILSIVIKLSGLFSLFYFFIINKRTYLKKLILFLIITFYFFLLYKNNFNNFFTSKIFNEMGQMNNFNLFNTINYSYHLLINANLHYITLLSFTGLFLKTTRKIFLIFIFPGLLYWTFLLSYDFRNMLFTIPAIIIVNSIVIEKIFFKIKFLKSLFILLKKINIKKINLNINFKLIYATIIIFLIIFSYYFDNEKLFKNNYDRKFSMIGNKEINIAIKSLILENKINKDNFVTDFQLIFFIPAFKDHFSWNDNFLDENKVNLDEFDYYLIYGHQKKIRKLIKTKIEQNKSLMLLNKNNFILVGKNN